MRVVSVCLYVFICHTVHICDSEKFENVHVIFRSLTPMFSVWPNETSTGVVNIK